MPQIENYGTAEPRVLFPRPRLMTAASAKTSTAATMTSPKSNHSDPDEDEELDATAVELEVDEDGVVELASTTERTAQVLVAGLLLASPVYAAWKL